MGFNEDDRIRRKNSDHNIAYQLYENLKREGLSNEEIEVYVAEMEPLLRSDRNEIYETVQRLVRSLSEDSSS